MRWSSTIWPGEGEEGQFSYLHHGFFSPPRTDLRVEIQRPTTLIRILLPLFSPWVILSRSLQQLVSALLFEGISTVYTHHKQLKALLKFWRLPKGFPVNKSGLRPENLHFKQVPRWRQCCYKCGPPSENLFPIEKYWYSFYTSVIGMVTWVSGHSAQGRGWLCH